MWGKTVALVMLLGAVPAFGHGGGLNAAGCHNDRKNGGYHCHRAPSAPVTTPKRATSAPAPYRAPTALMSRPAATSAIDAKVETIQRLLLRLGYQPGDADGVMKPTTQFAIMKFEEQEGMPIKGDPSSAILDALITKITE